MSDNGLAFYVNILIGTLVFTSAAIFFLHQTPTIPVTSGLFHMKFGGAVCGEHIKEQCGVTLKRCNDGKEYHCMHDISMELDKDK